MPKIKNMCGVACEPMHESRNQRHRENYLTTKVRKTGLGLVNFLFFQVFVCLAVLMIPTDVWAGLVGLSLDANGDSIFTGRQERLRIVFTVDENTAGDGDDYTITANQHFIRRGTVLPDRTVSFSWDGRVRGTQQLPDGNYTITVVLNKEGGPGEVLERSADAILDTMPPRISSVLANGDANLLLINSSFINASLRAITVIPGADEGSPIDFSAEQTSVVLKNSRGVVRSGYLSYTTQLNFNLEDPLDTLPENGRYTLAITILDKAGNSVQSETEFTFDNMAPNLTGVAGSGGTISAAAGVSQQLDFVEATLADNFENGVNLSGSTIRLTGPAGEILGRQTFPRGNKIRWVLLSPLLPNDGLHDGEYTIEVVGADKAGNQSGAIRVPFVYDNLAPKLASLSPTQGGGSFNQIGDTIYHNQPLTQIVASFDDGAGIGVDFEERTRIQFSAIRDGNASEVLAGRSFIDKANTQITYVLEEPLVSQDGRYRLEVQVADTLGNIDTETFLLLYDTQLPTLVSTFPASNETVSDLSAVRVVLNEVTSGIDFTQSSFRLTRDVGGTPIEVPVNITNNGTDTATLSVLEPIALDGSDDGTYAIEVTPTDRAGNVGATARREFYLVSQSQAEVRLTIPETTTVSSLEMIVTELIDYIGPGVDFKESTVRVTNPQGLVVPERKIETDETNNLLTWSTDAVIPRDGTADGEYTITATFVDFSGKRFTQEFPIVFDTQFPAIESVRAATESESVLSASRTTNITEDFSQIIVTFEDPSQDTSQNLQVFGSDVDFANTSVTLVSPSGESIPINRSGNGRTTLTLNFQALTQPGEYVLSITPRDLAGNQSTAPFAYRFHLDIALPIVSSVLIDGKFGTIVYVNGDSTTIVATFADPNGVGLVLGDGGSTITVTNESGLPAPGITTSNGTNQLTWIPIVLPTDGSADGRYTVTVTPIDRVGRQGEVVYRQFIFDTQEPRVTAAVPVNLTQHVSYIGSELTQLQFSVEDVGPADLDLEAQVIELLDANGASVEGALTTDEINNQLYFTLTAPFPQDGSADGDYLIKFSLIDKSGNRLDTEHNLVYDSRAPRIASVMINTDPPVELLPNRIAEILESTSSITLQFEEATRLDFANTQITLMGPETINASGETTAPSIPLTLEGDGTSQITITFQELEQVGSYTLSVTPQDVAGNTTTGSVDYTFVLDIPLPRVSSVVIGELETEGSGDVVYVNASNMLIGAILVDPTETGISFGSEGSEIAVTPYGETTIVRGALGTNGTDLIVWEPIALTSDGTTDGRYSVYVTPIDKAERQGSTVYREFIYDTQEPEIISSDPLDLSQPASYISQSLTQFRFTVADVGPADLELSDQKVSLRDASGNLIPAQLTDDTSSALFLTLNEPLFRDGSMDGEYTVLIELADKAGNAFTVEHLIVYDTQAPTLVSTIPADGALVTADRTQVQVTLNDDGGSGIDWEITTVTLINPSGSQISGELVSDGLTQLTLNTNQLIEDGRYIIRVQAVDRAGNGSATIFERSFLLSRSLPAIVSTSPKTAPVDEAFTNEEVEQIEVTLETDDENHLSTLRLLNAANQVVAGQQLRESDRLVYNLVRPLAVDGSDDGLYTIEFTPISASGRTGDVQLLTFTHDTEAPEIEPNEAINLVVAQPEVNNSLTEIRVDLTDEVSGIDWKNVDEEWLIFERVSPNPTKIAGRVEDDNQGILSFRLTVPLADNGSADGEYRITVTPKDQAGNGDVSYEKVFTYDTSPPRIDASTLLINDAPLLVDINAVDYPTAVSTTGGVVIQANMFDTGLGVNLAQSSIVVRRPDGAEVSGNTQQNGVDTLLFKSDGLSVQGVYQVTVISIGNDSELLGFAPTDSITTEFLYETTVPTAAVTSDGGETELTDKALPLEGTASDPDGTERVGEGEITVPASGVWLVEIVGTGPDKQPIDPVAAVDDSNAEQEPWSIWSIDFLPTRSGEYDLDVRVTDNAGNYEVYDIGEYTMSVSLTFREPTFGWPNPLRISKGDVAFFSFDVNVPLGETIELTLSVYDWSGDMVLSQTYPDVVSGQRNDQLVKWNLENQAGNPVARGLYIFRLEAVNAAGNSANAVGKVLVVD